jgi:hypothetical protein
LIFWFSLHVSYRRVHLQEDCCLYRRGIVRFTCISASSLVGRRVCNEHTFLPTSQFTKSSELYLMHNLELHKKGCLFKQLKILPVPCQCTLSLMKVCNNIQEIVKTNSSAYRNNTRNYFFRKISLYIDIRIINLLPHSA